MREPKLTRVPRSDTFPRGEKYTGSVEFRGTQRWVRGSYATKGAWKEAAADLIEEIRAELKRTDVDSARIPTVAEFAGVRVQKSGRVVAREAGTPIWPWTHTRGTLKKETAKRRYAEGLRKFVREYGDTPIDQFTRSIAKTWQANAAHHEREAVRRLFTDALDDELIQGSNPFRGVGSKKRRKDDPDWRVTTDSEFERLLTAAASAKDAEYSRVFYAMTLLMGESGMRTGEIFGLQHNHVHAAQGYIDVRWQIDDRGALTPVKNEILREVPISPRMVDALMACPRLSERWVFAAPRGGNFRLSSWSPNWTLIRRLAGADLAQLPFYELKHRAITWMVRPVEDGGLGIDPPTAAVIVGHQDGGLMIAQHYLKLDEREARDRVRKAMVRQSGGPQLRAV